MQNLIKNDAVTEDAWHLIRSEDESYGAAEDVILPLAAWLALDPARSGQAAPWLAPDADLSLLLPVLAQLPLIAIDFPAFTDGRGYSLARLLRERYGYQGELRAIGDVQRDQLAYLSQVGFTVFAIRDDRPAQAALDGLRDFSDQYQATVLQPEPLFKRRTSR
ncbi:DUF934 domain-containing protein [Vogesella alkaliphila]|uniref:DUF934 domain-containing protein n=1 Tax=Vogesella alkaliphila TaxID=1193621 RepID=A0ABQ2YEN3_9NEIS|nr:DUF934 domain-containing protein [Vogesella alkaliphila]GGX81920.1 hypothetical protein GCM10011290_06660 [Vogesella alkaliphila]